LLLDTLVLPQPLLLSLLQRLYCQEHHCCPHRSPQELWCSSHLNDLEALFVLSMVRHQLLLELLLSPLRHPP
jgi:hypothetical protein